MLIGLGLFGSALLYGDGVITPAISVLSAVEGLEVATPALSHFVVPITIAILIPLFLFQNRGTGRVGGDLWPHYPYMVHNYRCNGPERDNKTSSGHCRN